MEVNEPFVFQTDAPIVQDVYTKQKNYIIEYNEQVPKQYCIVYFSSNDIYYPNNEIAFSESIIKKNRFEWYRNRIEYGHKHIFFRDIMKQWYLAGVNADISSPDKMASFIKTETEGYKVVLVGSSAGGFIATILGQLIGAEKIYSFNGQFEIRSQLKKTSAQTVDPVLYRNRNNSLLLPYYDATTFIKNPESIFYFHSKNSTWDKEQSDYLGNTQVNKISFKTTNHGIPFLKSNLPVVLNMSEQELRRFTGKILHPISFSLQAVGLFKTLNGLYSIVKFGANKIYISTFQKWKKNRN